MNKIQLLISCLSLVSPLVFSAPLWEDITLDDTLKRRGIIQYRALRLDWAELANHSNNLSLPLPDGTAMQFNYQKNLLMAAKLAEKYPMIKSYTGYAVHNPAIKLRMDTAPNAFHAHIRGPQLNVYIDPYEQTNKDDYISYEKRNLIAKGHQCEVHTKQQKQKTSSVMRSNGLIKKTYRLAVAATAEYTAFHGTATDALAAIVTTINRVTGIYETDFSISFQLIANNDALIYTNTQTDPYTNDDPEALLDENQLNVDTVIGNANYDIGHVVSTGGGGIAGLGVVCTSSVKAQGVTGSLLPVADAFDVDFVAHEMGHQFGGNHTFSGSGGFCNGAENPSTAYEPNSGSTIMAYAGICDNDNLQPNNHDNFHLASLTEILDYSKADGNCASTENTNNSIPSVDAGDDYSIPANTPFKITGTASDGDGDNLSYSWEQFDLDTPLFRAFSPTASASRTFPKIEDIINNSTTIGETLPSTNRSMKFQLVVRDNHSGSGAINNDMMEVTVVGNAGPFRVTAPNTAVSVQGKSQLQITWDVASTDEAPVNCTEVALSLSTDGGMTAATILKASTENDGVETVTLPNITTTQARIKVTCNGNIFFDLSNADFTITADTSTGASAGDSNDDGSINVLDVIAIITVINGEATPGNSDCNGDGFVNVLDIICVINAILGL